MVGGRLAEAGVRFIEITSPVGWDHHFMLKDKLAESCRATDQPVAALLTDLKQRGMLEDTLVIWAWEFGRTPYAQSISRRQLKSDCDPLDRLLSLSLCANNFSTNLALTSRQSLTLSPTKMFLGTHAYFKAIGSLKSTVGGDHCLVCFQQR